MTVQTRDHIVDLPAHRLAALMAAGDLSATGLAEACLARIRATDPKLHAFVSVYADEAMAAAEARDRERAAGAARGPLHGIPIAIKDLCEIEGRITTYGSLMWRDRRSQTTATVVQRLEAAGMVVLGKTHLVEFAYGAWGTNTVMGTPWNPWDLATHRVPGGSSSGSAVAVAAGMAPAALGSDSGGSVRLPAAFCGTVGLKTTVGRVSNHGVLPLSETLDTVGPLARSVEDAALVLAALAGPDPMDPATGHAPRCTPLAELRAGVEGMRLGILDAAESDGVDGEALGAYEAACATLEGLGARLVEIRLPDSFAALRDATGDLLTAEGYAINRDWVEDPSIALDENVRRRMLGGRSISAADYIRALGRRREVKRRTAEAMAEVDAVLTPTVARAAIPVSEVDEGGPPASLFTRAANYLDLCALAVPCGLTRAGLPLSLQIMGHAYDEDRVLRIGWAYEDAAGWSDRRPDLSALLGAGA